MLFVDAHSCISLTGTATQFKAWVRAKYPKRGYLTTNTIKVGLNLKDVRENGHTTPFLLTCGDRWR